MFTDTVVNATFLFYILVVRTLTGHKSNIKSLEFHPYGDFVASGSLDTNIKVLHEFIKHLFGAGLTMLAKFLGHLRIWDTLTPKS